MVDTAERPLCTICLNEESRNLEHVNFHKAKQAEGYELQAQHEDHWACKPCVDLWLELSKKCPYCRDVIVPGAQISMNLEGLAGALSFLTRITPRINNMLERGSLSPTNLQDLNSRISTSPSVESIANIVSDFLDMMETRNQQSNGSTSQG